MHNALHFQLLHNYKDTTGESYKKEQKIGGKQGYWIISNGKTLSERRGCELARLLNNNVVTTLRKSYPFLTTHARNKIRVKGGRCG